jgi:hypothetical protein
MSGLSTVFSLHAYIPENAQTAMNANAAKPPGHNAWCPGGETSV